VRTTGIKSISVATPAATAPTTPVIIFKAPAITVPAKVIAPVPILKRAASSATAAAAPAPAPTSKPAPTVIPIPSAVESLLTALSRRTRNLRLLPCIGDIHSSILQPLVAETIERLVASPNIIEFNITLISAIADRHD
jgi:hypothetical protein